MASSELNSKKRKLTDNRDEVNSKNFKRDSLEVTESSSTNNSQSYFGPVVANHYNSIEQKGLEYRNQSRIVYMRNFNNWVKSVLIIKFHRLISSCVPDEHGIIVLDMGCGKGGDLLKWKKAGIRHLICADIASTSVEHCQERYEQFKRKEKIFSAEFVVVDCTKADMRKCLSVKGGSADIVSCQFSFHYCFESLSQAETMVRNISTALRVGGLFIATCPDANEIMSRLEASDTNSFGNEVFRIEFPSSDPSSRSLFGDQYNFFLEGVVDCPEFLVHFPTLIKICKKYGLELYYNKSFEEIYKEGMLEKDLKNLFFRMKSVELYPPHPGLSNAAKDCEYIHAKDFLAASTEFEKVKTISKSEWEAISLYHAFAFKKVSS